MQLWKLAFVCLALTLPVLVTACGPSLTQQSAVAMTGGDFSRGRQKIKQYGCSACHTIPGIPGADALVGPPLTKIADRTYVAGVLTNKPENMIRWIQNPPGVDPLTAMPNLGVTDSDARDIACYLYTLK
jgi:cytochrome c